MATGRQIQELLIAQNFQCAYSGKSLEMGSDATLDHKIPRSRGGSDDIGNLQWVSRRVNQMKTDFTHDEFIRACEVIVKSWRQNQKPIASAPKLMRSCAA
jgi:CRISPR/Cas system Type II protein with McrA/HNH and RuvC-like nuclease domain